MPTGVLMHSICLNNPCSLEFHIIVDKEFSKKNSEVLVDISNLYNKKTSFYIIDKSCVDNLPFGRENMHTHISISTYYRLFIIKLLPKRINKIIYLDGDTIVRTSLQELWDTNIEGYAIGAAHDMDEAVQINSKRLSYPMETGYFNAGVLLINLDFWRETNAQALFSDYFHKHSDEIIMHDQDVLNAVFYNSKKWIPLKFNYQNGFLHFPVNQHFVPSISDEVKESRRNPAIIHYTTSGKPWQIDCYHPFCSEWRKYKKYSVWKNCKLDKDHPSSIKTVVKYFLLRHNLWLPHEEYIVAKLD